MTLTTAETENGQSRLADQTLAQQFPRERAGEEVLIENPSGPLAGFGRAAVTELVTRLSSISSVAAIKSPLTPGDQGQISNDGRAALVTFQITGNPDTAKDRVGAALAATAAVQRAYPGLFVGELGDASAQKPVNASISSSFRQAEVTSLPITLVILVLAFGALIAAGVPLLLGFTDSSCRATPGESSKPPLPSPSTNQRESQVPASLPECCRFRPQAVTRPR